MEETKLQYKRTLENINKYHEWNTSVSYVKSLIVAFRNFYVRQKVFEHFHQISSFYKEMMFRPIEYAFAFSNYLFGGESPIVIHLIIQKFELSPVICKILYIMNKVVIWIDLDRFEQAENLMG